MLHRYAVILQDDALEAYRWAHLEYAIACTVPSEKSPKPPMRPAILDWAL